MVELHDWQYRIATAGDRLSIAHGPDIGCHEVVAQDGGRLGWLIGFPIDLGCRMVVHGTLTLDNRANPSPDDLASAIFERVAGQYLWVMDYRGARRIYPDVTAQVPCVYDPEQRIAALAVPAMWNAEQARDRFDAELFEHLRIEGEGWFPAGLTAHHGVHRLLPNHYLDLDSFAMVRFRGARDLFAPVTLEEATHVVSANIADQMEALGKSGRKLALGLTAGRDCRMVAAATPAYLRSKIDFVTLTDDSGLDVDTVMARRIAGQLGLRHHELARQYADDAARAAYIARGGHCIAGGNSRLFISVAPLRAEHVYIGGLGGEHARGYMWNTGDRDAWPTAESLLLRFSFHPHPRVILRVQQWLDSIDARTAQQVFEMAYMELREACWASAQFPCDPTLIRHNPMRTWPSIRAMLGLSVEDKQEARLADAMIERGWPELAKFPINTLGKVKDTLAKVRRVARNPEALARRLRRLRS